MMKEPEGGWTYIVPFPSLDRVSNGYPPEEPKPDYSSPTRGAINNVVKGAVDNEKVEPLTREDVEGYLSTVISGFTIVDFATEDDRAILKLTFPSILQTTDAINALRKVKIIISGAYSFIAEIKIVVKRENLKANK